MPAPLPTVLIAARRVARRRHLARILQACGELRVVAGARDDEEAMAAIVSWRPDVAVVDAELPGGGIELAREVAQDGLATRVVLLCASDEKQALIRGIALGAATAVPGRLSDLELCETVAAVGRGETRLPAVLQAEFVASLRARWVDGQPNLTPRQHEVLVLVADGLSAPQIAERLHLSHATIKSHLENLYDNLGVRDRAAAVAVAMRAGILA